MRWGREFAARLKAPLLLLLTGELGSGKTTLTKGIVAGLGAATEDDVTSPTFTLVHVYGNTDKVYHGDLYRIESFHDFETLGLEDVFAKPAVVILEWSEKFPLQSPWPQAPSQVGTRRRRQTANRPIVAGANSSMGRYSYRLVITAASANSLATPR